MPQLKKTGSLAVNLRSRRAPGKKKKILKSETQRSVATLPQPMEEVTLLSSRDRKRYLKSNLSKLDLVKVKKAHSGLGLFAAAPIEKGTRIIQYIGPILNDEEVEYVGGKYLFEVAKNKTINGTMRENIARYINHSCKPNCVVEIIRGEVWIDALRSIQRGEELHYDYGKEYFNYYIKPHGCKCGNHTIGRKKKAKAKNSGVKKTT